MAYSSLFCSSVELALASTALDVDELVRLALNRLGKAGSSSSSTGSGGARGRVRLEERRRDGVRLNRDAGSSGGGCSDPPAIAAESLALAMLLLADCGEATRMETTETIGNPCENITNILVDTQN